MALHGRLSATLCVALALNLGSPSHAQQAQVFGLEAVFKPLCERLVGDGQIAPSDQVVVLRWTRPISQLLALRSLNSERELLATQVFEAVAADVAAEQRFEPSEVFVPGKPTGCHWARAERSNAEYSGSDQRLLELSNLAEDPFAKSAEMRYGVFARLSRGGSFGASWYWIGLTSDDRGSSWRVSTILDLQIADG